MGWGQPQPNVPEILCVHADTCFAIKKKKEKGEKKYKSLIEGAVSM